MKFDSYFGESFDTPSVDSLLELEQAMEELEPFAVPQQAFDDDIDSFFLEALNFCQVAEPEELPKRFIGYAFIEAMKLSAACGGGYYFDTMGELDYELVFSTPSGYGGTAHVAQYLLAYGDLKSLLEIYIDAIHEALPNAMAALQYEEHAEANMLKQILDIVQQP